MYSAPFRRARWFYCHHRLGYRAQTALKPRLLARSLAEIVAADLSMLVSSVAHDLGVRASAPRTIPMAQLFPLELYTAVTSRLGELPSDTIIHVIATYRIFAKLNEAAVAARANYAVPRDPAASDARREAAEKRLKVEITRYGLQLDQAKEFVNRIHPKFLRTSRPWWSPRTRFCHDLGLFRRIR